MTKRSDRWGPPTWVVGLALAGTLGLTSWLCLPDAEPGRPEGPAMRVAPGQPPATALVIAQAPAATPAADTRPDANPPPTLASPASPAPSIPRWRDPAGDQTPDLADYVNPGEVPTMAQVIERLRAAGVTTGLAAFNAPGTRPPRIGLAVPEGFELPPGYVRHYQATDDGQRIEAVLRFAPDARPTDALGRAVALPADLVVPPELAPPGLPQRLITLPTPKS